MDRDASRYGPVLAGLLSPSRVMSLGPGTPNGAAHAQLEAMTLESAFSGHQIVDRQMAQAVLAGVWLYHDFLDESHTISQSVETPTGSYWHGIMHRREPDYDNARYWFRRVGQHSVFDRLIGEAEKIGGGHKWDPFLFIQMCERAARDGGELEQTCRGIQMNEWWELFDHCYREAIGA